MKTDISQGEREHNQTLVKIICECGKQKERIKELEAARIAYASEFDGDVGSIHENIRKLKADLQHQLDRKNERITAMQQRVDELREAASKAQKYILSGQPMNALGIIEQDILRAAAWKADTL